MGVKVGAMRCDECGREMKKTHRIYKDRRYCSTCYARVFKRRKCPGCKNVARLPKNDPKAVCSKCQNDKPCSRCMKTAYKIGKLTPYGPVCNACAPYFREPKPCEVCGTASSRLTRAPHLNIDIRVCPKCARATQATCVACRRHRYLQQSQDGRMLCKTCLEKGDIPCPKCGEVMPAGHGKQCVSCYWNGLLEKRIKIDCAAFSSPQMEAHFEAFGNWLGHKVGAHKASLTIHKYLVFFMEIEHQWREIPAYGVLLNHFGTPQLRRVLLPVSWMEESGLVEQDASAKKDHSDKRRILSTLEKVPKGSKAHSILAGYYQLMLNRQKQGKATLCSIRMALTPAAALLLIAEKIKCMPPDQGVVNMYLKKTPGQRAALSGFIRYLRCTHGADITLPKRDTKKGRKNRRKKLETEIFALIREESKDGKFQQRWLSVALAYFHGLPKKVGQKLRSDDVVQEKDGGFLVSWNGATYWIPPSVVFLTSLTE